VIVHDDMRNLASYLGDTQVDLIIFDPPYGIGEHKMGCKARKWEKSAESWDQFESIDQQYQAYIEFYEILYKALKPGGSIFTFGSFHSIYLCGEILQRRLGLRIHNSIVWNKINAIFNITQTGLIEGCEHIIWASKGMPYFNYTASTRSGKQMRNVWNSPLTPNKERTGHPHQKPFWIIERILQIACPEGGLVLDPMSGSGTTELACLLSKRPCLCIELNEQYYHDSVDRIMSYRKSDLFCPAPIKPPILC